MSSRGVWVHLRSSFLSRIKSSVTRSRSRSSINLDLDLDPSLLCQAQRFCTSSFQHDYLSKFWYWKGQYRDKDSKVYEWFLNPAEVAEPILNNFEQVQDSTGYPLQYLDLGCGLSDLSLHLLAHSPRPMAAVLVDFVSEALHNQADQLIGDQAKVMPTGSSLQLVCADVKRLPFTDQRFDVILDKGTMDALLKDRTHGHVSCSLMISEVLRVLTPGGRYIQVSDEDPDSRLALLENLCDASRHGLKCSGNGSHHQPCVPSLSDTVSTSCKLSSWRFEILTSCSGSEYFLYWTEKK